MPYVVRTRYIRRPRTRRWVFTAAAGGASQINVSDAGSGADALAQLAVLLGIADSGAGRDREGYGLRFYGWANDREDRVVIPLQGEPSNVGAGSFCIEWTMQCLYADNDNTASDVRYSNILIDHDVWSSPQGWCVGITRASGESRLIFGAAASSWAAITGGTHVGDGVVHRCALTRNQATGQVRLWVDGAIDATGTFDTGDWSIPGGAPPGSGQDNYALVLGAEKHDFVPGDGGYSGLLDELRISDVVRYTSSYTPVARLAVDGDTVALYHMDEGTGTTIVDAAGLSASGTLLLGGTPTGPVWVDEGGGYAEMVAAFAPQADAGAGADSVAQVLAALGVTDAGNGADVAAVVVTLAIADTGAGVDVVLAYVLQAIADSGVGADSVSGLAAVVAVTDAGAGADSAAQVLVTLGVTDAGALVDAVSLVTDILKSVADAGSGADSVSFVLAQLGVTDAGSGAETPTVQATLTVTDAGAGIDSALRLVLIAIADAAAGMDAVGNVTVQVPVADTGAAVDLLANLAALLAVLDVGVGVDLAVGYDAAQKIVSMQFALSRRMMAFAWQARSVDFELIPGG